MNRDIFKAIADPTRRDILSLIAAKKRTPNSSAKKISFEQAGSFLQKSPLNSILGKYLRS